MQRATNPGRWSGWEGFCARARRGDSATSTGESGAQRGDQVGLLRNLFAGWDSQGTTGVFFALVGVVWGVVGLSDRLLPQYSIYLLGRDYIKGDITHGKEEE